jgi:glutathione S-transferase
MNCKASYTLTPSEKLSEEIARIDAIWACCRRRFGENGNYLYGRFSIADCLFAPVAVSFNAYGAELSEEAHIYMQTLLDNPFVQKWITLGRREKEALSVVHGSYG